MEKADLSKGYQNPKRKLGVNPHFSEITELKFGKKLPYILCILTLFYGCLVISEKCLLCCIPRSAHAYGDSMDSNLGQREKVFKCACQLNYVIFTTECITGLLVYLFIFLRKSS